MNLDPFVDLQELQALAYGGVLDHPILIYVFDSRIRNSTLILKEGRQPSGCDVAAFVDGGGQNSAAVLPIPHWIVSASPKKRNAKWSACDDHVSILRNAGREKKQPSVIVDDWPSLDGSREIRCRKLE